MAEARRRAHVDYLTARAVNDAVDLQDSYYKAYAAYVNSYMNEASSILEELKERN